MQNIYISFPDIKTLAGQSTTEEGKEQIELLSYSHGVSMPLSAGAPSNTSRKHGRCSHQDFTITKYVDTTSPSLNHYCSGGNNLKKAIITIFQASEEDSKSAPVAFFTYELDNVLISSVSVGAGGGDLPIETISLNYTAIKWAYKKQKQDSPGTASGDVSSSWDLMKNA
ncbi:Hcp family type VI secretion system effector [Corallococcus exiguus]|uniref:Hcp family type VI secretion system effector n=1 Tax=Corallococcus exiguus TaxID=83462 RepID=UPI001470A29C|nr:type VI secretion system tube protein Hcp [Corallococcus exiguus]NNB90242.1 type VI secretion system tube protein Hcp [Corallococcus exiguus]